MAPQQARTRGSRVVPLSGGERSGLTRETETPTEAIPGQQTIPTSLDPDSRSQVGRPEGKAGASRLSFQASPLPRSHQGSGTKLGPAGLPQGESLIHSAIISRVPAVCQALSQKSRIWRQTGQSLRGGGLQRHLVNHKTAAKRKVLSVHKHREVGESLPLTFRPTSPQEAYSHVWETQALPGRTRQHHTARSN